MSIPTIIEHDSRLEVCVPSHPKQESEQERLERCAFERGSSPESYLVTEPGYEHFWDDQKTGVIGYIRHRKYLHIVGGLIAPHQRKEDLLAQFCEYVDRNGLFAAFYAIPEQDLPLFRSHGFQVTKFGENTSIDLDNHNWAGRHYSWVRRQTSFVTRQGIVAKEIDLEGMNPEEKKAIFKKLHAINREHLGTRVMCNDIELLQGKLFSEHYYRRRLFVACDPAHPDQWHAFVDCTPMNGGQSWATVTYRNNKQGVRGVIPFLMSYIIDTMKSEGVEQVSLCMVPALNCQTPLEGDSRIIRIILGIWTKRLNFLLNVQGLHRFKSRFRPQFTPVYLCVRSKATILSTVSFLKCAGVFKMNWKNLTRKFLKS